MKSKINSDEESESPVKVKKQEEDFSICKSVYGIYFCSVCYNMIIPFDCNGNHINFHCRKCGTMQDQENYLYHKQLQIGATIIDNTKSPTQPNLILDPTMPQLEIECPQCYFKKAVYFITSDDLERRLVIRLLCANQRNNRPICGHIWDLDANDYYTKRGIEFGANKFEK